MNNIRQSLHNIFYSQQLYWLNIFLVSLNFILIASLSFEPSLKQTLVYTLIQWILVFYIAETIARFLLNPKDFFRSLEHAYTAFVLVLAIVLKTPEISILFTFRLLKFMRHLNLIPRTRDLLDSLLRVLPGLVNLLILITMCYAVFGILGHQLFEAKVPELFGTVGQTLVTLSQIMVCDDWGNILNKTLPEYPYSPFFFISFLVTVTFLLLNAVVGVIVNAIQDTYGEEAPKDGASNT